MIVDFGYCNIWKESHQLALSVKFLARYIGDGFGDKTPEIPLQAQINKTYETAQDKQYENDDNLPEMFLC